MFRKKDWGIKFVSPTGFVHDDCNNLRQVINNAGSSIWYVFAYKNMRKINLELVDMRKYIGQDISSWY